MELDHPLLVLLVLPLPEIEFDKFTIQPMEEHVLDTNEEKKLS